MADHFLANPEQLKIVTGLQARTEAATRYTLIALTAKSRDRPRPGGSRSSRPSSAPPASISPDQTPTDRAVPRSIGPATGRGLPTPRPGSTNAISAGSALKPEQLLPADLREPRSASNPKISRSEPGSYRHRNGGWRQLRPIRLANATDRSVVDQTPQHRIRSRASAPRSRS